MTICEPTSANGLRSKVRALQRAARDYQSNSNLIERFDEITKIAYCKAQEEIYPERYTWDSVFRFGSHDTDSIVSERIYRRFRQLASERPDLFPDRFSSLQAAPATIRRLAEITTTIDITRAGQDVAGTLYEEIVHNTFNKGDNQQFFTPRHIVEFMVDAIAPHLSGTICDPACGTGGFLLYAARRLRSLPEKRPSELLGFEIDERLAWVAGMNLSIGTDQTPFRVHHLDGAGSLGVSAEQYAGTIDAIVTNPPFGSDLRDQEALSRLRLGAGKSSRRRGTLFIERCLDLLRPGGVVAIIIDDGALAGDSNKDARHLILERSIPLAIVSLPETAFMPYASVKASILILQKRSQQNRPHDHIVQTLFAEARTVGRKPNGEPLLQTDGRSLDSDLPTILETWQAGSCKPKCSDRENAPNRFWTKIADISETGYERNGTRLDIAYHDPRRKRTEKALLSSRHTLTSLRNLCEVRNETIIPCIEMPDAKIAYVGLSQIEAGTGKYLAKMVTGESLKSAARRFEPGDILYSKMRPTLRKVCLADDQHEEAWTSTECLVLRPRVDPNTGTYIISPELLAAMLRSDLAQWQTAHLVSGIGRPRISERAVLDILVPTPPAEKQWRMLEQYQAAQRAVAELTAQAERATRQAESIRTAANDGIIHAALYGDLP